MADIINAKTARTLTDKIIEADNSVLEPIMEKIHNAIEKKHNFCYISGNTPHYIIEKLKRLGYEVRLETKSDGIYDSYLYKVGW